MDTNRRKRVCIDHSDDECYSSSESELNLSESTSGCGAVPTEGDSRSCAGDVVNSSEQSEGEPKLAFTINPDTLDPGGRPRKTVRKASRNENEKQRRDRLNAYIGQLAHLVPTVVASNKKPLDKSSVLRLTVAYMRVYHDLIENSQTDIKWKPDFLKSYENLGSLLLEALGGFLFIVHKQAERYTLIFTTPDITKALGHNLVDILGMPVEPLIHTDDVSMLHKQFELRTSKEQPGTAKKNGDCEGEPPPASLHRSFYLRMNKLATDKSSQRYESVHLISYLKVVPAAGSSQTDPGEAECDSELCLVAVAKLVAQEPAKELYPLLEVSADQWITRHEMDGQITYSDQRGAWITGFLPEESIGLSAYALLHPEDIGAVVTMHNLFLTDANIPLCVFRMFTKSRDVVYIRTNTHMVVDMWTSRPKFIISINEVLKGSDGRKQLAEQQERLKAMTQALGQLSLRIKDSDPSPSSSEGAEVDASDTSLLPPLEQLHKGSNGLIDDASLAGSPIPEIEPAEDGQVPVRVGQRKYVIDLTKTKQFQEKARHKSLPKAIFHPDVHKDTGSSIPNKKPSFLGDDDDEEEEGGVKNGFRDRETLAHINSLMGNRVSIAPGSVPQHSMFDRRCNGHTVATLSAASTRDDLMRGEHVPLNDKAHWDRAMQCMKCMWNQQPLGKARDSLYSSPQSSSDQQPLGKARDSLYSSPQTSSALPLASDYQLQTSVSASPSGSSSFSSYRTENKSSPLADGTQAHTSTGGSPADDAAGQSQPGSQRVSAGPAVPVVPSSSLPGDSQILLQILLNRQKGEGAQVTWDTTTSPSDGNTVQNGACNPAQGSVSATQEPGTAAAQPLASQPTTNVTSSASLPIHGRYTLQQLEQVASRLTASTCRPGTGPQTAAHSREHKPHTRPTHSKAPAPSSLPEHTRATHSKAPAPSSLPEHTRATHSKAPAPSSLPEHTRATHSKAPAPSSLPEHMRATHSKAPAPSSLPEHTRATHSKAPAPSSLPEHTRATHSKAPAPSSLPERQDSSRIGVHVQSGEHLGTVDSPAPYQQPGYFSMGVPTNGSRVPTCTAVCIATAAGTCSVTSPSLGSALLTQTAQVGALAGNVLSSKGGQHVTGAHILQDLPSTSSGVNEAVSGTQATVQQASILGILGTTNNMLNGQAVNATAINVGQITGAVTNIGASVICNPVQPTTYYLISTTPSNGSSNINSMTPATTLPVPQRQSAAAAAAAAPQLGMLNTAGAVLVQGGLQNLLPTLNTATIVLPPGVTIQAAASATPARALTTHSTALGPLQASGSIVHGPTTAAPANAAAAPSQWGPNLDSHSCVLATGHSPIAGIQGATADTSRGGQVVGDHRAMVAPVSMAGYSAGGVVITGNQQHTEGTHLPTHQSYYPDGMLRMQAPISAARNKPNHSRLKTDDIHAPQTHATTSQSSSVWLDTDNTMLHAGPATDQLWELPFTPSLPTPPAPAPAPHIPTPVDDNVMLRQLLNTPVVDASPSLCTDAGSMMPSLMADPGLLNDILRELTKPTPASQGHTDS